MTSSRLPNQESENLDSQLTEDEAARQQALDPRRSFIIQAPAGSGKTELLIQRILGLLGKVEQPEEILAITFTRKAAGEMRERLFRALKSAAGPEPEAAHEKTTWQLARKAWDNSEKHGWRLLEHPARLRVQTIDSFCANLVRRMPWLSRFGAQASVKTDATELYQRAAEKVLALADREEPDGHAARRLLAHVDNRAERLCDLLVAMLARRNQWLRHLAGQDPEQQRISLEDGLKSLAEHILGEFEQTFPLSQRQNLMDSARCAAAGLCAAGIDNFISRLDGKDSFPRPIAEDLDMCRGLCDLLLTAGGTYRKRVDKNCGFPADKNPIAIENKQRMMDLLDELREDEQLRESLVAIRKLPPVVYDNTQWEILQGLVSLLPRAVAELWLIFQECGQTDFVEIAQAADRALGEEDQPTDLMLHLDSRIQHILVDEFQDTSWGQFLLLEKLIAGWQQEDGRSLFLVGDPMQSIYRFREAEVGLYLRARRLGLGNVSLIPLNLRNNFRSQQGIVQWVNLTFPLLFPSREDEARGGVAYAFSDAVKGSLAGEAVSFHPSIGRADGEEARQVAAIVLRAREEDPQGKIAILVRARSHLLQIIQALREQGLTYVAQEIDPLIQRPVAQDLLALTRALLHAGDRVAHLAVLRAPWCGLSLDDLHALVGDAPDRTIPELLRLPARLKTLSEEGRLRATRVLKVLTAGASQRGRVPLRPLVENAWLALGGPACIDPAGLQDAAVILDLLEELDHGGDLLPFEAFADQLAKLYASPDPGADDSLQLMTIHKAKGLEFDTVILPGLGRRPRGSESPLLRWLELPSGDLLLAPIAPLDGRSCDPIYDSIGRLEKERQELEIGRVLYVAATRAKKRLHLLGHARIASNGDFAAEPGSFLDKLWPVVAHDFSHRQAAQNDGALQEKSLVSELRRLPIDWQVPDFSTGSALTGSSKILQPSDLKEKRPVLSLSAETDDDRHIGNVCHQWFEKIATEGLEFWSVKRLAAAQSDIRHRLAQAGLTGQRLEKATRLVLRAIEQTIESDQGRWVLSAHAAAECEIAISGVLDGQMVHGIVDRTFIDSHGARWIIDYKISEPKGLSKEAFMAREGERYRSQVTAYLRLMEALEPERIVRAVIYFPLFDGWFDLN